MPTAGRLAGALAYAIYGWYVGAALVPFFPEANPPDFLFPLTIGLGVVCGWVVVGSRSGKGYYSAIGHGLTGAFAFTFWLLFLLAFHTMIRKALRRFYDGPMDAVVGIFGQMIDMGQDFAQPNLIASLAIGGVIGAWVAEYYAQRYP